jgi:hypothetical protein
MVFVVGQRGYRPCMGIAEAALWGLAGGGVAGLVELSLAVRAAGFHWPWRGKKDGIWPRMFVFAVGLVVGAGVAAGASSEITGPWPALLMGVGAPAVIQGILSRGEVAEAKPPGGDHAGSK